MNLHDGKAKLSYATEKLGLQWDDVRAQWDDAASRDFQRDHLEPLQPLVANAVRAIERLAEILTRAQQECS